MNSEQTLADIEQAFENSKAERFAAKKRLDAAEGRYHLELIARRNAGEVITQADMKAYEDTAIDSIDYVRDAYLNFTQADIVYRKAKVEFEAAKRNYWDSKPLRG